MISDSVPGGSSQNVLCVTASHTAWVSRGQGPVCSSWKVPMMWKLFLA